MLELKDLTYEITEQENGKKIKKKIINKINLKLDKNETVVITGPNGSGKSTLTKLIMGIVKPTSGKIYFEGKDITNLAINERAKLGISFAFQQPVKFKGITVQNMLELATSGGINITKACEVLSDVGLCARDYISREINSSLSGGELKRIEIASVVARGGKLAIFDEPEAGIDLWSFNSLIGAFAKLKEASQTATIIISHQERLINVADKVILLKGGTICKIGRPSEILKEISPSRLACTKLEVKNAN